MPVPPPIQILAIELTASGTSSKHITRLWWRDSEAGMWHHNTVAQLVAWIEDDGGRAYLHVDDRRVPLEIVTPTRPTDAKYLRARVNDTWTDDLLSLPHL